MLRHPSVMSQWAFISLPDSCQHFQDLFFCLPCVNGGLNILFAVNVLIDSFFFYHQKLEVVVSKICERVEFTTSLRPSIRPLALRQGQATQKLWFAASPLATLQGRGDQTGTQAKLPANQQLTLAFGKSHSFTWPCFKVTH